MKFIAVTNNKAFRDKYEDQFEIAYYDVALRDILIIVRDMVHAGHTLLSHPLSGSVKPNETFIKTVFVSLTMGDLDMDSVVMIENSIITCDKFVGREYHYENVVDDFQVVDTGLAESALIGLTAF